MVPTRAAMEQHPIAIFLITVGKSSDETEYTTQNDAVIPNFPIISRNTATAGKSGEIIKKTTSNELHTECPQSFDALA